MDESGKLSRAFQYKKGFGCLSIGETIEAFFIGFHFL
jgi:hypothetical protein